jgi:hypothetical protein
MSKKKMQAASALAAAAFGGWLAVPVAHAGFNVSILGPFTDTENSADQIYVATATNLGSGGTYTESTGNTGSMLVGMQVSVTPNSAPVIDIEKAGLSYSVNIDGTLNTSNGGTLNPDVGGQPVFGDGSGGTFIGIGNEATANDPQAPDQAYSQAATTATVGAVLWLTSKGTSGVYLNGSSTTAVTSGSSSALDANFKNTLTTGLSTNNTISSLLVDEVITSGTGSGEGNVVDNLAVPFANIVVKNGTTGSVSGLLGGDLGLNVPFSVTFGTPVTTGTTTLSLSGSTPASSNLIADTAIVGGGTKPGSYVPQSFAVTGAAQTNGYLEVSNFLTTDPEIYALDVVPGGTTPLSTVISDLQTALGSGGTVKAITSTIGGLFLGDNVEVDFASGFNPAFFAYNLAGETSGTAITSIGVVPEPTGVGVLILGGLGLAARRRRASRA